MYAVSVASKMEDFGKGVYIYRDNVLARAAPQAIRDLHTN